MVTNPKTSTFTKEHLEQLDKYWDSLYKKSLTVREKILNRFLKDRENHLSFLIESKNYYSFQITTGDLNIEDYNAVSVGFFNPIFIKKFDKAIKDIQALIQQFQEYVPDDNPLKQMLMSHQNYESIQYEIINNLSNYIDIKVRFWGCTYRVAEDNLNIEDLQIVNNKVYSFTDIIKKFFNLTNRGTLHLDQELLQEDVIDQSTYLQKFSQRALEWRKMLFENSIYYNEDPSCTDKLIKNMICGIQISPNINIFSNLINTVPEDQRVLIDQVKDSCSSFELYFFGMDPLLIDAMKTYTFLTKV